MTLCAFSEFSVGVHTSTRAVEPMKICVYSVHIVVLIIDIIIIIIAFGLVLKTAVTPFRHFDF